MSAFKYTGQRFGRLVVVDKDEEKSNDKNVYAKCRCDCGNITSTRISRLKNGYTKSCGCLNKEVASIQVRKNLKKINTSDFSGLMYGELEVLKYYGSENGSKLWQCKCHRCGKIVVKNTKSLTDSKSCGCLRQDTMKKMRDESVIERKELKSFVPLLMKKEPNKNNVTTGIRGVCQLKDGTYSAYISVAGIRYQLKRSRDITECIKSRKEAEENISEFIDWYKNEYKKRD